MCRLSKDMEKNGDHIAGMNTGNVVQANQVIKDRNAERELIKNNKNKIQEDDEQLPAELQHTLHLSSSGSDADSTPQKALSNNTSTSEGSLTSASPQSTVEPTRTHMHTHTLHHRHANHLHLHTSLQHDNHDHHYNQDHNRMANQHKNHLNLEHDNHHDNDDDHQNHMHADAPLDSNGCNSTHMFSTMLLNGDATTDDCECTAAPFFLPKNAWMASSSSGLEEPTFFSSSIVNGNLSTPSDLSLMSTSVSKSTSILHTHENAHQRTLPFLNNNLQFMEAASNFHQVSSDHNASVLMNDPDYTHYANVPSFSSFLAASPSYLQSEKTSHHVDFLGAGDGNGTGGAECSMYQSQIYMQQADEDDAVAYMQYQNAAQAQNWHNAMQQENNEGAYTCYWASTPQGMVPVMPSVSGGIGAHASSYVFNAMELQQAEQYYNAQQQGGHGTPMLTHSQSVPLYLEHFGSAHQSLNVGDQRFQIALSRGGAEAYGSSMSEFRGAVRSQIRKTKELSSCSSAMEFEDQGPHADHSWVDGHGAVHWRSGGPHRMVKGTSRHSNKRSSPDGEEEESVHESAPPLKRSASWDSMGLYHNKHMSSSSSPLNEHHMNHMMKGSMITCKSTSPKQDKPRARQGIANDPQSIAARHRRERISERLKILQQLVPNGSKVDLVTMLEKAINYVKFLQLQVKVLATDEYWPTPLNKFPKVAAMAKLAADSKEPANLEKVEKALAETIQATS